MAEGTDGGVTFAQWLYIALFAICVIGPMILLLWETRNGRRK